MNNNYLCCMERNETLSQLAARLGRNYDTVYRAARKIRPEEKWTTETPVPADVAAELSGGNARKHGGKTRRKSVAVPAESAVSFPSVPVEVPAEKPEQVPTDWSRVLSVTRSAILIGIVLGHAGLVWYDCADLWSTPGSIGGGLVFFIVLAAVMFAADPAKYETRAFSLAFVAIVDISAFWVHYPVFSGYGVEASVTKALCWFVCLSSWTALALYQNSKT